MNLCVCSGVGLRPCDKVRLLFRLKCGRMMVEIRNHDRILLTCQPVRCITFAAGGRFFCRGASERGRRAVRRGLRQYGDALRSGDKAGAGME